MHSYESTECGGARLAFAASSFSFSQRFSSSPPPPPRTPEKYVDLARSRRPPPFPIPIDRFFDLALPLLPCECKISREMCSAREEETRGPRCLVIYTSRRYTRRSFRRWCPSCFFSRISSTDTRHLLGPLLLYSPSFPPSPLLFSSRLFSLVLSSKTLACLGALIEPRESNVCVRETNLANTNASLGSLFTQNTLSSHLCHTLFPVCVCVCVFLFFFYAAFFFIAHTQSTRQIPFQRKRGKKQFFRRSFRARAN